MVALALLGCGRIGQMHAANLAVHPDVTFACLHDADSGLARAAADRYGVAVAESAEAIMNDPSVDGMIVATPTGTHVTFIEAAVAAGKPILCEKPIDLDIDRVNRCAAAIAGTTVPIQIGFNRRFDSGHRRAREAARSGAVGAVHQIIITSRDPALPDRRYIEAAGGLLRDMTIHDFDLARYMLDEEPVEVFAVADALIDPALGAELHDHDTAMVVLRTRSGRQCLINNSRTAVYGYDQRVEFLGERGMLVSGNRRPDEVQLYTAEHTGVAAPLLYFFEERYRDAFMAEISAFADCIRNGTAPEPGFDDGRMALVLAEAAYRSIAERRLVRVDEVC